MTSALITISIWMFVLYGALFVVAWTVGQVASAAAYRREVDRLTRERLQDIRRTA